MHYTYRNAMRDRKTHGRFEVTFEDGIRVYIFFETPTPQKRRVITIWILNERKQGHEGSSFFHRITIPGKSLREKCVWIAR